jgi:hypothetical protein
MYRHALPPGFVLKSEKKAMNEAAKANTISLEEFLEVEVRWLSMPSFPNCYHIQWLSRPMANVPSLAT